ncbi:MAG: N-acetylmuramoyl-L-alanine amidase [Rubellimicrobium sp.]|nr:N-acetylmuramoyl-L-alanine amidase [Rubellimicrobium sp.]
MRTLVLGLALLLVPGGGWAQAGDFTALARLDPVGSRIEDTAGGGLAITLYLSQPVPWRVFTLDAPMRLVLDFREVDWRGATRETLGESGAVRDLRFGTLRPGWSRMVLELGRPLVLVTAGMAVDPRDQTARLDLSLAPGDAESFAAAAGAPPDPGWDALMTLDVTPVPPLPAPGNLPVIAIDPGHGGIDPGAERGGTSEAALMLALARDLAEAIDRSGTMRAVLTRSADVFVPLEARMTIARRAGAVALVSLHADALEEDAAHGASVYTLTEEALDQASQRMAERHERGDLLAGMDLAGTDDTIATVLMDLARLRTTPQSERLAEAVVAGLETAGARLNSRPRRQGPLAVLNAADFASVLVEAGFLSDEGDRAALSSTAGRAPIVAGLTAALRSWLDGEERSRDAVAP